MDLLDERNFIALDVFSSFYFFSRQIVVLDNETVGHFLLVFGYRDFFSVSVFKGWIIERGGDCVL